MREVRRAVAHRDLARHADAGQRGGLARHRVGVAGAGRVVEVDVDDRRGQELDRRKALVERARGAKPLDQSRAGIGSPVSWWRANSCRISGVVSQCS